LSRVAAGRHQRRWQDGDRRGRAHSPAGRLYSPASGLHHGVRPQGEPIVAIRHSRQQPYG
jgi:hypothetical protein